MSTEPGVGGAEAAPREFIASVLPVNPLVSQFKEEDEDDMHKCGRCQAEFTSLEDFVHHKIQKSCHKVQDASVVPTEVSLNSQEVVPSAEDSDCIGQVIVETSTFSEEISSAPDVVVSEEVKDITSDECSLEGQREGGDETELGWQESHDGNMEENSDELTVWRVVINEQGRYVCQLCQKTFKTSSILKAHMNTHSSKKEFECELCGNQFRTKGSLIRHNRRHTDERPYVCSKCGKSFRESGALSRHLKSITPCTEKIQHMIRREAYTFGGVPPFTEPNKVPTSSHSIIEATDCPSVISLVTDHKGNILHEVQVEVEELVVEPPSPPEDVNAEQCETEGELLHDELSNSGIVIETVTVENDEMQNVELKMEEVQIVNNEGTIVRRIGNGYQDFTCPHCDLVCRNSNHYSVHLKGHEGCKLFRCRECGREFLKAHLLRKHEFTHYGERKYKCGDCGKLYKTITHVKGHMRVHSEDRPYPCHKCGKRYKTKNAMQVHFRTHLEDKPFVCQYCSRTFREKGSLVRHIRHHTGERPFKCHKCDRAFAEHGTLNRHLRIKGGCTKHMIKDFLTAKETAEMEAMAERVISEEPQTVLVDFSSVVADTQEYIIEAAAEDSETNDAAELIQDDETHEVEGELMSVVQEIVSTDNTEGHIIVHSVALDNSHPGVEEVTTADTIAIATPESLTAQVAMTLASAIGENVVIPKEEPHVEVEDDSVIDNVKMEVEVDQSGDFVITSHDGDLEVQTVIV
ncbi:transcription factor E4F1 isoform X2 [Bombina bombina]|uniref:transcription factor E4F1 isoform X2 n=1 Tax=Bombina bombina TaxID=8345 RepID=UPI00235AB9F7|nr:transcription factor E4F1 isoform X2 [Bombina bombina]